MVEEQSSREAQDFNELIRVTVVAGGERVAVAGTGVGPSHVPHLAEVWDHRFMVELEPHVSVFRYRDVPGMIGHLGTVFGRNGDQHLLGGGRPPGGGHGADGAVSRRWS